MTIITQQRRASPSTRGGTTPWGRLASLYASSVGRKYVMALSGLAIVGFVLVHLLGTLKIFLGPIATNEYGEALRNLGEDLVPRTHLLWILRIGLTGAPTVHMHAAFSLHRRNRRANGARRPTQRDYLAATFASRTMLWSGIIVALFVVFHVADLTWGTVNPNFQRGDAYNNQINSFRNPAIAGVYLIGVAALASHLYHGLWSLLQSVGAGAGLIDGRGKRRLAAALSVTIGVGYASIPVAVLTGVLDTVPSGS